MSACSNDEKTDSVQSDSEKVALTVDSPNEEIDITLPRWDSLPIPPIDSITPHLANNSPFKNSPSSKYFNPSDSGVFISYMLVPFDLYDVTSTHDFDYKNSGKAYMHTYWKNGYGYDTRDDDQTFIRLAYDFVGITLGKSVNVGKSKNVLIAEFGTPIYSRNDSIIYLGSNQVIGLFKMKDDVIQSIDYGRYNINDSTYLLTDEGVLKEVLLLLK